VLFHKTDDVIQEELELDANYFQNVFTISLKKEKCFIEEKIFPLNSNFLFSISLLHNGIISSKIYSTHELSFVITYKKIN